MRATRHNRTLFALAAIAILSGCGTPVWLEGVIADEMFTIRDSQPSARELGPESVFLLFREDDGKRLRMATLQIEGIDALPLDEPIALADTEAIQVIVSEGDLVETERPDGATEISSDNTEFFPVEDGAVTFTALDENVGGTLEIDVLGGSLGGDFFVDGARCR